MLAISISLRSFWRGAWFACAALLALAAGAAEFPAPKEGNFIIKDFKFHTGQVMPELRIHYVTVGNPGGEPVLMLHGTTGSTASMLTPAFAGELYGPGQALDASRYYIIIPDAIGTGKSTKPSDGLRTNFPQYNYDDMVEAQYRLVKEGLGIKHLRLVMGNSMGGMQTWMWGVKYPGEMDALVPMASQPTEMSSRNWMLRRFIVESIRNDPEWNNGNYTKQPRSAQFASVFFAIATSGGTLAHYKNAPTRAQADKILDARLNAKFALDANDALYQWASSADYNPSPGLERIQAAVLVINAADDERNPPETGVMDRELKRIKNAKYHLIPASEQTAGHGTTGSAKWYKSQLAEFLQQVPRRGM
jgi:homoserine O-acetyltransferase/O-succinyltransferase